jgi:hypothetical protein
MIRTCPHCKQKGIEVEESSGISALQLKSPQCLKCGKKVSIQPHVALVLPIIVLIITVVCAIFAGIFVREVIRAQCFSWTVTLIIAFLTFPLFKKMGQYLLPIKKNE